MESCASKAKIASVLLLINFSFPTYSSGTETPNDEILEAKGYTFRKVIIEALEKEEKEAPSIYYDLSKVCQSQNFIGMSIKDLDLLMKGAGQKDPSFAVDQVTKQSGVKRKLIASGFGISSTAISRASFTMLTKSEPLDIEVGKVVEVVSCGVKTNHL